MQAFFDQQQQVLADMLDNAQQNNVGHFVKQIYLAGGGLAGSADQGLNTGSTSSDDSLISRLATAAQKSVGGADTSVSGGKYGESPLGQGFYNSPAYLAQHFTQMGDFFKGSAPGNEYTNRYEQPVKGQPTQSTQPNDFYARFYEGMRRFSEAEEVANHGNVTTRSR